MTVENIKSPLSYVASDRKTLGIQGKIFLGFITMAFITIISVIVTLIVTTHSKNFSNRIVAMDFPLYEDLIDLNAAVFDSRSNTQALIITRDMVYKTKLTNAWEVIQEKQRIIDDLLIHFNNSISSRWNEFKTYLIQLNESETKIVSAIEKNDVALATQLLTTDTIPLTNKVLAMLNSTNTSTEVSTGFIDVQSKILSSDTHSMTIKLSYLHLIELIILAVSIIASIIIALVTTRKIVIPLNKAIGIAKNIATGKRDIEIEISSSDETGILLEALRAMQTSIKHTENELQKSETHTRELFDDIVRSARLFSDHSGKVSAGDLRQRLDIKNTENNSNDAMVQLGHDLNKMTDNLSAISKEITQACHSMVTTLEEVRHAVDSQSSGASEQAASINEITASISEIDKSTMQTMDKAKALGEVAERTRERGQLGLDAIEQSVQGMKAVRDKVQIIAQTILDLSNQTQQVGEITAVVNNLAQQSKMLALNASIEAAKAGESGKGFAVVASEVKNLAEQSEHSTEQVQKILEDIKHATEKAVMATEEGTKGVDHGTELVEQTGEIIRSLNEVIHETTIASQQIEAAVRQESAGIEQITAGMNEINQVTSTFVESVKQTTEAMANLSNVAKNLQVYVETYKV